MQATDQRLDPVLDTDNRECDDVAGSHALFIVPTRRGDGFDASIQGHMLELADPTDHLLAPSPDDLFVASIRRSEPMKNQVPVLTEEMTDEMRKSLFVFALLGNGIALARQVAVADHA